MQNIDLNGWIASSSIALLWSTLCFGIITLIAWSQLFRKAGEGWWKIFIPFYGVYTMYKISNSVRLFCGMLETTLFLFISTRVVTSLSVAADAEQNGVYVFFLILTLVLLVVELVLWCWLMVKTAHAFDKSTGFAIGLILLYPVFILILAFGKSRHIAYDVTTVKDGKAIWVCPHCGSENIEARGSCLQCGQYR